MKVLKAKFRGTEYYIPVGEGSIFDNNLSVMLRKVIGEIYKEKEMATNYTANFILPLCTKIPISSFESIGVFNGYLEVSNKKIKEYDTLSDEVKEERAKRDDISDQIISSIHLDTLHLVFSSLSKDKKSALDKLLYGSTIASTSLQDGTVVLEFPIDPVWISDVKKIISGEYSRVSKEGQDRILANREKNSYIKQIFEKDPIRRKQIEERFEVTLDENAELMTKIPVEQLVCNIK